MAPQLRLSALKGPQEETPGVIVISVQVVPDEWGALEDGLHLGQAIDGQLPGDDLTACGAEGEGNNVFKKAKNVFSTRSNLN